MSQVLLIQRTDIIEYRSISANLNVDKKLNPCIVEAQDVDLKKLLGNAFYNSLMKDFSASPSLSMYSDLFFGSDWTCGNKEYSHKGLRSVLCLYAYSRYVIDSTSESTAFGTEQKKNEYSEHVEQKRLQNLSDNAKSTAWSYWEDVKNFLDDNKADYPLWTCAVSSTKSRISGVDNIHNGNRRNYFKNR